MQSTPEKKRVIWKPISTEDRFPEPADESNGSEESALASSVRCNLSKECDNPLDPSERADFCLESPQNPTDGLWQASDCPEKSIASSGPESMARGDERAIPESASSPVLPPARAASQIESAPETVSSGGLSEEEKHAGMKRRYSMLQQNLRMPAEEERRLQRERLRKLVPIWTKKRADA